MVFGQKSSFAVEIELMGEYYQKDWYCIKSAIWLENCRIGKYNDINISFPFLNSLSHIVFTSDSFWEEEFTGLSCHDILYTMDPFMDCPDDFYEASDEVVDGLIKYDKFIAFWGENFDQEILRFVCHSDICKFLWLRQEDHKLDASIYDSIRCTDVPLETIKAVYLDLLNFMPDPYREGIMPTH